MRGIYNINNYDFKGMWIGSTYLFPNYFDGSSRKKINDSDLSKTRKKII